MTPGDQGPPLQPQRQAEWPAERARSRWRARPLGQQARAMVAACEQPVGQRDQGDRHREQQQKRPPALVGERPRLLRPADRRQPAERVRAGVAAGPDAVGGAQHRQRDPVRRACVRRELGADRGDRREEQAHGAEPGAEPERARHGQPVGDQAERHAGRDQQVRAGDHEQRRGRGRVAAGGRREHQLRAPGLLVPARVPADEQQADQRGEDREEDADLERDEAAERVQLGAGCRAPR